VIGSGDQLVDEAALGTQARRERTADLEFSDWGGRFGYQLVLQTTLAGMPAILLPESYL
jgi:hypothetical protein